MFWGLVSFLFLVSFLLFLFRLFSAFAYWCSSVIVKNSSHYFIMRLILCFLNAVTYSITLHGHRIHAYPHTTYAHSQHSPGSIPASRHHLPAPFAHPTTLTFASYRVPINTWVESDKCRLMSCQRTLVPCRGSNHDL